VPACPTLIVFSQVGGAGQSNSGVGYPYLVLQSVYKGASSGTVRS